MTTTELASLFVAPFPLRNLRSRDSPHIGTIYTRIHFLFAEHPPSQTFASDCYICAA